MFSYFNNYKKDMYNRINFYPEMRYISNRMTFNVKLIQTYFRSVEKYGFRDNSPLYNLINSFNVDISLPLEEYYKKMKSISMFKCNAMGFGSEYSLGKIYPNEFYLNSSDIFYTLYSEFDSRSLNIVSSNWREQVPFRPIYHTLTDLDYECRPKMKSNNDGLAIFEVDVNKLMIMFYMWAKERKSVQRSTDPSVFLSQFVYPNSLKESVNINIWNIIRRKILNPDLNLKTVTSKVYPVYTVDIGYRLDSVVDQYYNGYKNMGYSLGRVINSMPVFDFDSSYQDEMMYFLRTSINPNNRNTVWLLWGSRIDFFRTICVLLGERGINYNRGELRSLQKDFLAYRSGGVVFPSSLPLHIKTQILEAQNDLLDVILKDFS